MKRLLIGLLILSGSLFAESPHAWDCFKVDSITMVDSADYEVKAHNQCNEDLPTVLVLVKYMDKDGNRLGVGMAFVAHFVAAHEKIRRQCSITDLMGRADPYVLKNVHSVMVRAIRDDELDEFK